MGEGVEARSEKDVLGDSIGYGVGERVFGVTAARDEEGAEADRERLVEFGRGFFHFGEEFPAEDGDGNGIVEDERLRVVELMRGAAHRDTESGSGREALLHCVCGATLAVSYGM
jgi:hypothetical protein